jgi:hypothetical protein
MLTTRPSSSAMLRMRGVTPPLPRMRPWRGAY